MSKAWTPYSSRPFHRERRQCGRLRTCFTAIGPVGSLTRSDTPGTSIRTSRMSQRTRCRARSQRGGNKSGILEAFRRDYGRMGGGGFEWLPRNRGRREKKLSQAPERVKPVAADNLTTL